MELLLLTSLLNQVRLFTYMLLLINFKIAFVTLLLVAYCVGSLFKRYTPTYSYCMQHAVYVKCESLCITKICCSKYTKRNN